ncbi:hypothetical protein R3F64_01230 [Halomonas sp. 5021]|uniref:hypothetical protein n=1 Tax=Halomonas sp. 5021 TaxID=3082156 RepID=UPI002FC70025
MSFNAKRNDPSKFTEGTWVNILGGQFKVARAGSAEYEKALEDCGYRKQEEPQAKQEALYTAIATGILRDWREVVDCNDKTIPYSVENAVEVMLENPDLVGRILNEASDLANFRREDLENQKKKQ